MSKMPNSRDYSCAMKPVLTQQKKEELRAIAKYSDGQPEQMKMLCDFVPCNRALAPWLKKELGL